MKRAFVVLFVPLIVGCGAKTSPPKSAEVTFTAADGGKVYADLYRAGDAKASSVILMFHQAGSSAAEYYPIAPRVAKLGFDCLAVDLRSGGDMYGPNRTAEAFESDPGYEAAYKDMLAAADWARKEGYRNVILWGSSYSATLCFRLASAGVRAQAIVAFSPGEYFNDKSAGAGWARTVRAPTLVVCTDEEAMAAGRMLERVKPKLVNGSDAIHGSSTLRPDKNAGGAESYWAAVETFLKEVAAKQTP